MRKSSFAAFALVAVVALPSMAQAAPVFGFPDVNFAAASYPGRPQTLMVDLATSSPMIFGPNVLQMGVLASAGDQVSENSGSGFAPLANGYIDLYNGTGGATNNGFAYTVDLQFGQLSGPFAEGSPSGLFTLTPTSLGYDGFGEFTITYSDMPGFTLGQTVGVDLLVTNVQPVTVQGVTYYTADVKGDVAPLETAPAVPEPTTLGLLVFGVLGLAARRRSR
jgi:hypothetical protein